ncbi:MAG: GNAT family N-acetyltransferase [Methanomassiliicoccales archaeon]|jgi:ribosomal protein S18 acetylase RimI-like enzyme|nr:GNAT family N-acetyltransferase [Methanomassiliicoccales archaeon]MDD1757057.1 GNAT family N-acetyltransferase [Methanomassiliicoccales archaeon]
MKEVELLPMTHDQFQGYLERAVLRYAKENIKAGYRTYEDAERRSREDHRRLLPQGIDTPLNFLMVIRDKANAVEVGALWLKIEDQDRPVGFVYDIFLEEEHRGKGLGKATMAALGAFAKEKGLRALYLHVFSHNTVAIRLYEGAGFKVKSMNMEKLMD